MDSSAVLQYTYLVTDIPDADLLSHIGTSLPSNFQSYVYSTPYSIYCITETWLSNSVFYCEILPCEYTLYHKDRRSCGGVVIAVSDSMPSVLISSPDHEELEII